MRDFTEEQVMFREAFRKFLEQEVAPHMPRFREQGIVDREIFKKAGDQGFLMIWPDEKYGGMGDTDFRYEQIIIEETGRAHCFDWFNTLHSRLVGPYIDRFGTEEQKQRFLPDCVSGDKVLAVGMSEPDAGSDLAGIRTIAVDKGDHFLVNGSKTYISNGINADYVVTAAKLDGKESRHAMVLLIIERGMEGFERGRNLDKMGLKGQDTAELFFKDVKVPKENVLGTPGKGFHYLMEGLAEERLIGAIGYYASARAAFKVTREFVLQRKAFGKRIADFQNTQFKLAEAETRINILGVYLDHLVALHNKGELSAGLAARGKLEASEAEWQMVDLGVQLHGGAGYMEEYEICRMFLDARVSRIYAGSSEIMKLIISREILDDNYYCDY